MKKYLLFIASALCTCMLYSQGFVYTTDGKMYFSESKDWGSDIINVSVGDYTKQIPKSDIVLIEHMENGITFFQKEKLHPVEPKAYDGDYESFLAKGRKVYVPVASTTITVRCGAKRLRELLVADGYWKVVGCPEEADFIMTYKFSEEGRDHAYLLIYDRMDEAILKSPKVSAKDFIPAHAGIESAEKLFKRYIKEDLQAGKYKWIDIWNKNK